MQFSRHSWLADRGTAGWPRQLHGGTRAAGAAGQDVKAADRARPASWGRWEVWQAWCTYPPLLDNSQRVGWVTPVTDKVSVN